jgi:hypothetical protein
MGGCAHGLFHPSDLIAVSASALPMLPGSYPEMKGLPCMFSRLISFFMLLILLTAFSGCAAQPTPTTGQPGGTGGDTNTITDAVMLLILEDRIPRDVVRLGGENVVHDAEGRLSEIGFTRIAYDDTGAITRVGVARVTRDSQNRPIEVGGRVLAYDGSDQVVEIGDSDVRYADGRIVQVGSEAISYSADGDLQQVGTRPVVRSGDAAATPAADERAADEAAATPEATPGE